MCVITITNVPIPSKPCGCAAAQCIRQRRAAVSNSAQHVVTVTLISFLPCDAMRCTVLVIVILSVCPSVTLVDCVHTVRPTIMISSPYGSLIILVSGDIKFIPKFEGDHPERGCWMRVGWVRIGDFWPISRRISEMVQDTTKVTINH